MRQVNRWFKDHYGVPVRVIRWESGMATNRHAATSCLGESRREQIKPRHWCGAERYRL
nr:DUF4222 domain-containing protein [Escherichia coli]